MPETATTMCQHVSTADTPHWSDTEWNSIRLHYSWITEVAPIFGVAPKVLRVLRV